MDIDNNNESKSFEKQTIEHDIEQQPQEQLKDTVEEIYTYSTEHRADEPTVQFDAPAQQIVQTSNNNTGLKVFFSLIAVTVALIIAVSAGYIFGKNSSKVGGVSFSGHSSLADKNDAQQLTDKTAVFNAVSPSVVSIFVYDSTGVKGYASGVVYTADGYIVTNDHIYASIPSAQFLITTSGGQQYNAQFVAGDTRSDLAVLKADATGLTPAVFGKSEQVLMGEEVIAIGYPSGSAAKPILTAGAISSESIRVRSSSASSYSTKMIQTDTAINPGNSGGALVNMYSQVIGIPSVKLTGMQYDNVGYAIPSNTVVHIADSLIKYGYVNDRGKLGITYTSIDTVLSQLNGLPTGLYIESVDSESDLLGKVFKGDIITHINDVKIVNTETALDIIENTPLDEILAVTVYHTKDNSSETVYARLVADQGNSSYNSKVAGDDIMPPFSSDGDSYKDH